MRNYRAIVGENALAMPAGYDSRTRIAVDSVGNVFIAHPDLPPMIWWRMTGEWGGIMNCIEPRETYYAPVRLWGFWGAGSGY